MWSDTLPDTTNDLDGIRTHGLLTMSGKHLPLSYGCSLGILKTPWVNFDMLSLRSESILGNSKIVYMLPHPVSLFADKRF